MEESERRTKTNWMTAMGLALLIIAVLLIIWFFLKGETRVSGGYPGAENSKSISCTRDGLSYPFFTYDGAEKKTTEVNIIFNNENVGSISLIQKMYYDNTESATKSSTSNHVAMNNSFGSDLGADALGANYNVTDNVMRLSLYARGSDFNAATRKYFLADAQLKNMKDYEKHYEKQGFSCIEKTN